MDGEKIGKLILKLRTEKRWTQKELAERLFISDRTVSKWERGRGVPDVSLFNKLSEVLEVDVGKMLSGNLGGRESCGGDMRKLVFYVCPVCGNVVWGIRKADVLCCGKKLSALTPGSGSDGHAARIEESDGELYVTLDHEMRKEHYISFAACVGADRVLLVKLYPEQNAALRLPQMRAKKLIVYCSRHGLWESEIIQEAFAPFSGHT